jgi:type III pantothenate kinase
MNLVVDIGNTTTKLALLQEGKIIIQSRFDQLSEHSLNEFLSGRKPGKTIISSVKEIPGVLMDFAESCTGMVHILSPLSKFPFKIGYKTPETLGPDRIAAVAGAYYHYHGTDSMVIDAGTAITFEFLEGSVYTGGNISPGIDTRFRALHDFTEKLPLLKGSRKFSFPGSDTYEAIIAGVVSGVIFEINEYIRTFEEKHSNSVVILTGGDGDFLKDKISGKVSFMPDIVADGLNFILEYNAK